MSAAIPPVYAIGSADPMLRPAPLSPQPVHGGSFAQMLMNGVDQVSRDAAAADAKVTAFTLDDTLPPHEVIFAIEQARHSLELMLQVRSHLVEGFQEIMRMQL
jgi:flagellar hook-basal body complex protein FliE